MRRVVGVLLLLVLLAFALPALFNAIESVIIPGIFTVFVIGLGVLMFQRRRRW